jgi:hypothetical protein
MTPERSQESVIAELLARVHAWRRALIVSCYVSIGSFAILGLISLNFRNSIIGFLDAVSNNDDFLVTSFANSIDSNEGIYQTSSILDLLAGLFSIVSLIGWTHANAKLANKVAPKSLSFSTGWAVGAWFVPFINFVRPREIIKESQTVVSPGVSKALLNTWWGFFVTNWIITAIQLRLESRISSALEGLSENASWSEIESKFYDYSAILSFDVIGYWVISMVPAILLLVFVNKTPPLGNYSHVTHGDDLLTA